MIPNDETTSNFISSTLTQSSPEITSTLMLTETTKNSPTTSFSDSSTTNTERAPFAEALSSSESDKKIDTKPEKLVEDPENDEKLTRKRRSDESEINIVKLIPGACVKGCAYGFLAFTIISSIINSFGASGRIGNLLGENFIDFYFLTFDNWSIFS